jgi:uncharacterized protein YkwD
MTRRTHRGAVALAAAGLAAALLVVAGIAPAEARPASDGRIGLAAANALEGPILARLNAVRRARGLPALRSSAPLARAAHLHAASMGRFGFFSHSSRNGESPSRRIGRFYGGSVGETILWRSPGTTAAQAVRMWLASPPHRAILLSRSFRDVGIGAVRVGSAPGYYRGLPVTIVVADVGRR